MPRATRKTTYDPLLYAVPMAKNVEGRTRRRITSSFAALAESASARWSV
jgi:hypothetical protein